MSKATATANYFRMFGLAPDGKTPLDKWNEKAGENNVSESDKESDKEVSEDKNNHVQMIPIDKVVAFKDHPFKVTDDESMEELVQSVKDQGILVPVILRKIGDKYEIISGHRRCHALKLAGMTEVPAEVKECSDDEATIMMVDTNLVRDHISVSEKAKAYKMKYEAMKALGKPSLRDLASNGSDSFMTIKRLVLVADLNDGLLDMIDNKNLSLRAGVEFAKGSSDEQETIFKVLNEGDFNCTISMAEIISQKLGSEDFSEDWLRDFLSGSLEAENDDESVSETIVNNPLKDDESPESQEDGLNNENVNISEYINTPGVNDSDDSDMAEPTADSYEESKPVNRKKGFYCTFSFDKDKFDEFFDEGTTPEQAEDIIIDLLTKWKMRKVNADAE